MAMLRSYRVLLLTLLAALSNGMEPVLLQLHKRRLNVAQRGEALTSGDTIFLRAHTGKFITVQGQSVHAKWGNRLSWEAFVVERYAGLGAVHSGETVFLRAHTGNRMTVQGETVHAQWDHQGPWQQLIIEKKHGNGPVHYGDSVFLLAHTGKRITVESGTVHAKWDHQGAWQELIIEGTETTVTDTTSATILTETITSTSAAPTRDEETEEDENEEGQDNEEGEAEFTCTSLGRVKKCGSTQLKYHWNNSRTVEKCREVCEKTEDCRGFTMYPDGCGMQDGCDTQEGWETSEAFTCGTAAQFKIAAAVAATLPAGARKPAPAPSPTEVCGTYRSVDAEPEGVPEPDTSGWQEPWASGGAGGHGIGPWTLAEKCPPWLCEDESFCVWAASGCKRDSIEYAAAGIAPKRRCGEDGSCDSGFACVILNGRLFYPEKSPAGICVPPSGTPNRGNNFGLMFMEYHLSMYNGDLHHMAWEWMQKDHPERLACTNFCKGMPGTTMVAKSMGTLITAWPDAAPRGKYQGSHLDWMVGYKGSYHKGGCKCHCMEGTGSEPGDWDRCTSVSQGACTDAGYCMGRGTAMWNAQCDEVGQCACACEKGYYGRNCELKVGDPCDHNDCNHHAVEVTGTRPKCECMAAWTGHKFEGTWCEKSRFLWSPPFADFWSTSTQFNATPGWFLGK